MLIKRFENDQIVGENELISTDLIPGYANSLSLGVVIRRFVDFRHMV